MPPIWLITLVLRTGIPSRFAKAAAWLAAVVFFAAVIGLLGLAFSRWVAAGKEQAIAVDRQDVTIEAANRVINATAAADANQMARDDAYAEDQKELRDAAVTNSTAEPVGPGVRSVLDRMREQQAARRGH